MVDAVNNWRARVVLFGLALVLGLTLVLAVNVRPAEAHGERALHRALNRLDARLDQQVAINRAQSRRLDSLRNLIDSDFCLFNDAFALTWDNLNSEPNLTIIYPSIEPCPTRVAAKAVAVRRMALERMH
jgi:hypothetical protein